jgi:hypothetical protein
MLKGYTVPIIDFSDEKERQIVVDKEEGLYIGHPTTVLLDDMKTIVAVYPKNHGYGQIVLKKSFDGGKTWSERLPVPESFSTSLETPTIYKVCDKNGKRRLILFSGLYPIRMSVSEDDGNTWSELAPIGDFGGIVAMGDICCVGKGEYFALFHDDGRFIHGGAYEKRTVYKTGDGAERRTKLMHSFSADGGKTWSEKQDSWVKTLEKEDDVWQEIYSVTSGKSTGKITLYQTDSHDGGLTWSEPRVICTHDECQLCEPAVIRSPDGKELCAILRENARKKNSHAIFSSDNGKTWSAPVELQGALTGDRHCARYLKDGRLFISFRDTCLDSPTWGDWCAWLGSYDDIKNGGEGICRIRIMKNYKNGDCAYPGVEILPDGTIVTTTYGHFTDGEEAYVVCVRICPDEIDEKLEKYRV